MNFKEELFYRYYLFSKEDILQYLVSYAELVDEYPLGKNSRESIEERKKFIQDFIDLLRPSKLPEFSIDDYKYYDVIFNGAKLELYTQCVTKVELNDDNTEIDCLTTSDEELVLDYECKYITVEDYAVLQGVRDSTVQKWLDKGKLKFAKYVDGKWNIPVTQCRPGEALIAHQYFLEDASDIQSFEFPLAKMSSTITVNQDYKNKEVFKCNFWNQKKGLDEDFELTKDEEERLSFMILTSGKAEVRETFMQIPNFDRYELESEEISFGN